MLQARPLLPAMLVLPKKNGCGDYCCIFNNVAQYVDALIPLCPVPSNSQPRMLAVPPSILNIEHTPDHGMQSSET